MKDWNFDEIIDRRNTASMKWEPEVLTRRFGQGKQDLLPLWVADMDFKSPTVVREAIQKRLEHQVYGYSLVDPAYNQAVVDWYRRRHGWTIRDHWISTTPGIVPAVNYIVQQFSQPGDHVLLQPPVYYPFAEAIRRNGRRILENPLTIVDGRYRMDFDDLEKKASVAGLKIAILCSPHNPVGRVWSPEELERFGRICIDNGILVLADEIHCDLIMPGHRHTCFASLSETFARHSITANSASKTFNLAGLQQSSVIIPNPRLRQEFVTMLDKLGFVNQIGGTLFGAVGAAAAYNGAEQWLDELIVYLHDNYVYMKDRLERELPGVTVFPLEGTYLAWVDFRGLNLTPEEIVRTLEERAGVALDHGTWFGANGAGFERVNIACPRAILEDAVTRIVTAFQPDRPH